MYLCHQNIKWPVLPVLPGVSLMIAGLLLLLFCTLIGGTTTVRTVGLLGSVSGATHATRGSQFWLPPAMKRRPVKGLLLWPEASEAGELSTVSQPLSCSSSDILQKGNQWPKKFERTLLVRCSSQSWSKQNICRSFCLNHLCWLYLLGCLQGEVLDWAEAEELVLSVLSGLLREQTLSILTVLWHASQSALPLHLCAEREEESKTNVLGPI